MAGVGALIGLPMFFEIGLVLLMPVIYLVARRAQLSVITIGIPTLAGLSAMHGLVPPHPGPLRRDRHPGRRPRYDADARRPRRHPDRDRRRSAVRPARRPLGRRTAAAPVRGPRGQGPVDNRPSFGITLATVLLPVVLMMAKAIVDIIIDDPENRVQQVFDVIGNPFIALLIAVVRRDVHLRPGLGDGPGRRSPSPSRSRCRRSPGILLIVAAGGGFKQVLVDTGIGTLLADWAQGANFSVLLLAWVIAVLIRLATGSATVATITASALMVGLVEGLSTGETSLVVLAIGSGSVFFSHVNDAGFWLVKEYFGLSVGQTIKSWSLMETVLSVSGLVFVLLLGTGDLAGSFRAAARTGRLPCWVTSRSLAAAYDQRHRARAPAPRSGRRRRAGRRGAAATRWPRPRPGSGRTALVRARRAPPVRGRPDRGPVVRRARQVLGTPLGQLRHQLHPDDRPVGPVRCASSAVVHPDPAPTSRMRSPGRPRAAAASPRPCAAASWSARGRSGSARRSRRAKRSRRGRNPSRGTASRRPDHIHGPTQPPGSSSAPVTGLLTCEPATRWRKLPHVLPSASRR